MGHLPPSPLLLRSAGRAEGPRSLHTPQGTACWRGHERPVSHPLQHSVLEPRGWASHQRFYFLPCRMTFVDKVMAWAVNWAFLFFPQPPPWVSVLPMRWDKVLARGERQYPSPSTVMFLGSGQAVMIRWKSYIWPQNKYFLLIDSSTSTASYFKGSNVVDTWKIA